MWRNRSLAPAFWIAALAAFWLGTEYLRAWAFTGFAWNPLGVTLLLPALLSFALDHRVRSKMQEQSSTKAVPYRPKPHRLRDLLALASWYIALTRRTFVWRGHRFGLTKDGKIVPRDGVELPLTVKATAP